MNLAFSNRPNIILIVADDLGWKDSAVYGSKYYSTPGIDRLAREGIRFTNAYSANPLCSPTRASILTGQYPSRLRFTAASGHISKAILDPEHGTTATSGKPAIIPESRSRLPNEYVTYAELLKEVGYKTAFVGKWHLGRDPHIPENQGFDIVVGGRHHPGPPPPGHFFAPWDINTIHKVKLGTHISDAITKEALDFIRKNKDGPFLLNLWYYDVHAPFQAKQNLIDEYEQRLTEKNIQRSPTMGAMIEAMDSNIEDLLEELDRLKIRDNTIIIFTSDNGGNMYDTVDETTPTNNYPLRSGKGNNYEGGVRVPLIVSWPKNSIPGTVSDSVISSVDFYPTILDMVDLPQKPSYHIDGVSFSGAIRGFSHDRGPTISHFPHYIPATNNLPNTSIRVGDFKLYRFYYDGPDQAHRFELYNLREDIGETKNLSALDPERVEIMDKLIQLHLDEANVLVPIKNPTFQQGSAMGWVPQKHMSISQENNNLRIVSTGNDPYMTCDDMRKLKGPFVLKFRMHSNSAGAGQVYWNSKSIKGFSAKYSKIFPINHDDAWHDYELEIPLREALSSIRLDPSRAPGVINIKDICLLNSDGVRVHEWK